MISRALLGALLGIIVSATGCQKALQPPEPAQPLTQVEADAAVARLASYLPDHIGTYTASQPPTLRAYLPDTRLSAERTYTGDQKSLTVELCTGDISALKKIIAQDAEHAFMSDTDTYWHTLFIRGYRARVAERRQGATDSVTYVGIGGKVVAQLEVSPAAIAGESASLAELMDLEAIEKAGIEDPGADTGGRR